MDTKNKKLLWFIVIVIGLLLIKPIYQRVGDAKSDTQQLATTRGDPALISSSPASTPVTEDWESNYNQAHLYLNRALEAQYNGDAEQLSKNLLLAQEAFSSVLSYLPNDASTLINRAVVYYHLGEYELALQDVEEALRTHPQSVDAMHNKMLILEAMGRFTEAAETLAEEIEFYEEPGGIQEIRPHRLPELRQHYDRLLERIAQGEQ